MAQNLRWAFGVCCAILLSYTALIASAGDITASVSGTQFVGETGEIDNHYYASFTGIKYGEAGRFQRSTMYRYRQGRKVVKRPGNVCPQITKGFSWVTQNDTLGEDCLFLNIHTPIDSNQHNTNADLSKGRPTKPVLVFLYGEKFERGSSYIYKSFETAAKGDFIVVTLNYRVSVFGFLTTDDHVMPPNLGLFDQKLAIKWIYDNIAYFGGDNSRISLLGHSAGSMSTIIHAFSPENDNYFQNAISHSGTPIANGIVAENGKYLMSQIAAKTNCSMNPSSELVRRCLKRKTWKELVDISSTIPPNPNGDLKIGPVKDNNIISEKAFKFFSSIGSIKSSPTLQPFTRKNLIISWNDDDGDVVYEMLTGLFVKHYSAMKPGINIKKLHDEFLKKPLTQTKQIQIIKLVMMVVVGIHQPTTQQINMVLGQYNGNSPNLTDIKRSHNTIEIITDLLFAIPAFRTAQIHTETNICPNETCCTHGRTYVLKFKLPPGLEMDSLFGVAWFKGTGHNALMKHILEPKDQRTHGVIRDDLIKTLGEFVKQKKTVNTPLMMSLSDPTMAAKIKFWNQIRNQGKSQSG